MSYQDEAECLEIDDLLDEVLDLAQGDDWDGYFTVAGGRKFDAFKEVLAKRIQMLTAERDAAIKSACELYAFDSQPRTHWPKYSQATRELLRRQTDAALAAAQKEG